MLQHAVFNEIVPIKPPATVYMFPFSCLKNKAVNIVGKVLVISLYLIFEILQDPFSLFFTNPSNTIFLPNFLFCDVYPAYLAGIPRSAKRIRSHGNAAVIV